MTGLSTPLAVRAEGLTKRYGKVTVLDRISLQVPAGTVAGLLGPNGAGKTTAVRIFTTLLRPDAGRAEVAGFDVCREPAHVRSAIGLVGQHAAVDEILSGYQNLVLFGRLRDVRPRAARQRARELLARFELEDAADMPAGKYSPGMRRRLDLAATLILPPKVLFLDEPTTGLDPHSRAEVWRSVRAQAAAGTAMLLTTQYLEEADQLASQITIIDAGAVIAQGSPGDLKSVLGASRIHVKLRDLADLPVTAALLTRIAGTAPRTDAATRCLDAPAADPVGVLTELAAALRDAGIAAEDIALRRPTLDEVFVHLTRQVTAA
ncbi:MAG TPA: ATP-binding cassette domain-containing protein [Streptosporangiaceae bacterium]